MSLFPTTPSPIHKNISTLHTLDSKRESIHRQAVAAAETFRKSEGALVAAMFAVDQSRVYLALGYPSLFVYATEALRLSEAVAYNTIAVTRKSAEIPALQEKIENGALSVSKARKILPVLTVKNHSEWLDKATTLTSRALEREVARVQPQTAKPERATYVTETRLNVNLSLDESTLLELRQIQDQVSRSLGRSATLEDTLRTLVRFYRTKNNRVEKARRVIAKKGNLAPLLPVPGQVQKAKQSRTPIPAAIQNAIRYRDQDQCQARLPTGKMCGSRRWIHLHHIKAIHEGGTHSVENITTLCEGHHRAEHMKIPSLNVTSNSTPQNLIPRT